MLRGLSHPGAPLLSHLFLSTLQLVSPLVSTSPPNLSDYPQFPCISAFLCPSRLLLCSLLHSSLLSDRTLQHPRAATLPFWSVSSPHFPSHLFPLSQLHPVHTVKAVTLVLSPYPLSELPHQRGLKLLPLNQGPSPCRHPSPPWRSRFPLTSLYFAPASSAYSLSLLKSLTQPPHYLSVAVSFSPPPPTTHSAGVGWDGIRRPPPKRTHYRGRGEHRVSRSRPRSPTALRGPGQRGLGRGPEKLPRGPLFQKRGEFLRIPGPREGRGLSLSGRGWGA